MRKICIYKNGGGISRSPILSCSRGRDTIQIFLVTKAGTERENREVYLEGRGSYEGRQVNFQSKTQGANGEYDSWSLKVWKDRRPGYTELMNLYDSMEDEGKISCNKENVFTVIKGLTDGQGKEGNWESPITSVKLTLQSCKQVNELEECDVAIAENLGLKWNPAFQPKAIFK